MKLSVIIPVYNEINSIKLILECVRAVDIIKEIIIVDDFSTDGTREILAELADDTQRSTTMTAIWVKGLRPPEGGLSDASYLHERYYRNIL